MPFHGSRSSYPGHREGEDADETEDSPPERALEYDDDTMELLLPSGERTRPEHTASCCRDDRGGGFPSLPFHTEGRPYSFTCVFVFPWTR